MKPLSFTVPGRVVTNNLTARTYNGVTVKNPDATDYQSRVASYAIVAVRTSDWRWPASCIVRIRHWNGRVDVDNTPKSILDGMKGIVFPDDRRRFLRGVHIEAEADGGEEYVEISVEPCEPLPEIIRRKCARCLEVRPGVRGGTPFICGRCAQIRKKAGLVA